jgi:hypothetical protein
MIHELYLALLSESNPRHHPALLAMLYSFCPAAAGWWMSGINPPKPEFNGVWSVLEDSASGRPLQTTLEEYGLGEDLIIAVKVYLHRVEAYRRKMPGLKAPELLPLFEELQIDSALIIKNQNQIHWHFGGKWRNVLEYARIWSYVVEDWTITILDDRYTDCSIQKHDLKISLPGTSGVVSLPAWTWEFKVGRANYRSIGFITNGGVHDLITIFMGSLAAREVDQAGEPRIYSLDPLTGEANCYYRPVASREQMVDIVLKLDDLARTGPYLPVGALVRPQQCHACPFQGQCFDQNDKLSAAVIQLMDHGAA